jgi:hypothetical protein
MRSLLFWLSPDVEIHIADVKLEQFRN